MILRHDYTRVEPDSLPWWDDVAFVFEKMLVEVSWLHPRQAYQYQIQEAAEKNVQHLYKEVDDSLLERCEAQYNKVGKSRKKICGYRLINLTEEFPDYAYTKDQWVKEGWAENSKD